MSISIVVNEEKQKHDGKIMFGEVLSRDKLYNDIPIVLAKQNNKYYELNEYVESATDIEFIDISTKIGMDTYKRTAQFIFIKAALDIFKDAKISIEHSINKGIYGEIHKDTPLTQDELLLVKKRMQEIVDADSIIEKIRVSKEQAKQIFINYKMEDKIRLLNYVESENLKLYKIEDRYDYFYGEMAYSTGVLKTFDLLYYNPGFIIRLPRTKKPNSLPDFYEQRNLYGVFKETTRWLNILGIKDVGALNNKIVADEFNNMIRVSEALHEKKIAYIADKVLEKKDCKLILVAGPSSSGKTTFTKRLAVQLQVNGLKPVMISLDDYFLSRDETPLDEEGNPDFECLEALDLDLFHRQLKDLLDGKEVEIPSFNFKKGKREWLKNKLKLKADNVLLIEGIHGLNDKLTSNIEDRYKFKVYISALTQLNLDNHNKISTTDVRKIRRIVRDALSRGYDAEKTLSMWSSIKRGEENNIFVFQENSDVMFNSTLVYELSVLKNLALKELNKINENSEVYYEAKRLKTFLGFFEAIEFEDVPKNSILREFIGGSCFYKY